MIIITIFITIIINIINHHHSSSSLVIIDLHQSSQSSSLITIIIIIIEANKPYCCLNSCMLIITYFCNVVIQFEFLCHLIMRVKQGLWHGWIACESSLGCVWQHWLMSNVVTMMDTRGHGSMVTASVEGWWYAMRAMSVR